MRMTVLRDVSVSPMMTVKTKTIVPRLINWWVAWESMNVLTTKLGLNTKILPATSAIEGTMADFRKSLPSFSRKFVKTLIDL
jgi:hypothetical protein